MLTAGLIFIILVCFCIPIGGMIFVKKKWMGEWRLFFIGALAFFISQICIRIPILTLVLPQFPWFQVLSFQPWAYGLFLGGTAALFEEGARWIAMALMERRRGRRSNMETEGLACLKDGVVFGLGHGGIEAMLLVGLNAVVLLVMAVTGLQSLPADAGSAFAAGAERIFTLTFHIGASVIMMYGVRMGKAGRCFLLAFILHMALDASVVVLPAVFLTGTAGIELLAAAFGAATLGIGIFLCRNRNR